MGSMQRVMVAIAAYTSVYAASERIHSPGFTYDSEELRRLFAPMEPQTFFSMHFQKQHIHLQRNNRTYFADLAVPDVEQFISKLGRRKDVYIAAPPKPMHNDPDGPGGPGEQQQGSGGGGGGDGLPEEVSVVQLAHDTIRMRSATAVPFLLDLEQLQDGEITKLIDSGGTVTIILEEFVGETREAFERTHPALAKFESSLNSLFGDKTKLDSETPGKRKTTTHIYATGAGTSGQTPQGLTPHTDAYDVMVAQIQGTKLWTLCTPNPKTLSDVFREEGVNDGDMMVTEADKCELKLQEAFKKHDEASFYAEEDMKEFDCRNVTMNPGDTLYVPKGLVHYARIPEEATAASVHLTVALDRVCGRWLDFVAHNLNIPAERITDLVNNTQLGVELAKLAPTAGAKLLPLPPGGFEYGDSFRSAAADYAAHAAAAVQLLVEAEDKQIVQDAFSEALAQAFTMEDLEGAITSVRPDTPECKDVYSGSGDVLTIHYSAAIDESSNVGTSGRVISSSYSIKEDGSIDMRRFRVVLGDNAVLKGLEQGVYGMCVGEKRVLVVPSFLAYDDLTGGDTAAATRMRNVPLNPDVQAEDLPKGATLRIELEAVKIVSVQFRMAEETESHGGSIFETVDANKDYFLDKQELTNYFERNAHHGVPPSIWNSDKNKDGFITWQEFEGPKGPPPPKGTYGGNSKKEADGKPCAMDKARKKTEGGPLPADLDAAPPEVANDANGHEY